jgi:hypothetical protein
VGNSAKKKLLSRSYGDDPKPKFALFEGIKRMKKLALALLFCGAAAFADSVTYTTAGTFTSNGTNSITVGGATITYEGVMSPETVNAPTFTNVGTFVITGGTGTFSDAFTLTISETVPTSGSQAVSSPISGEITSNSSGIELSFTPSTFSIGEATWMLYSTPLNNPSVDGGDTTVQAFVSVAPEPGSLGLVGAALVGIGAAFRRRMAK